MHIIILKVMIDNLHFAVCKKKLNILLSLIIGALGKEGWRGSKYQGNEGKFI